MNMTLESQVKLDESVVGTTQAGVTIMMTPRVDDEDYWIFRVKLSETQAIVGFPKFGTIGIGFLDEEDWNTNLPYTVPTADIFSHIEHNKGDDSISDADVRMAIALVQDAASAYMQNRPPR